MSEFQDNYKFIAKVAIIFFSIGVLFGIFAYYSFIQHLI